MSELAALLRRYDFEAVIVANATVNDLYAQLAKSLPVIVRVQLEPGDGHAAIVYGYTTNTDGSIKDWLIEDNGYARGV